MDEKSLSVYFALVDTDRNGLIDRDEFQAMLSNLGLVRTVGVVDRAFKQIDSDGNEQIDLGEFTQWWRSGGAGMLSTGPANATINKLKSSFAAADNHGHGRIDIEGFRKVLADLDMHPSSSDLRLTFSQTPRHDSRYFTFDEFLKWWLEQAGE